MNRLIMKAVLSALLVLGFVGSAQAGAGKAYYPTLLTVSGWRSNIFCSNITDQEILVTVSVFKPDGELIQESSTSPSSGHIMFVNTDVNSYHDYYEYATGEEYKTVSFWLKPQASVSLAVMEGSTSSAGGYGIIEWSGCANGFGMVAHGMAFKASNSSVILSIPVNGGNPF